MATAGALGTALALAAPLSASAATPNSFGSGQFLSGSIAGINLDELAAIKAAQATNTGQSTTQVSRDPLGVSALGTTVINEPNGIQLNLGKIVNLGAVNQYAQAANTGKSMAASGAVNNDGGVGAGTVDPSTTGSTVVDLDSLLGNQFGSVISDLKLQAGAVAATASASNKTATGKYNLAGLTLDLTSPALGNLDNKVSDALDPINTQVNKLSGDNGDLEKAVSGVVTKLNPLLNLAGVNANVDASVDTNLKSALKPILTGDYTSSSGAVTLDLGTGTVHVDLAKLLGGNINNEPVGTQVLSDTVVNKITNGLATNLSDIGDQVVDKVNNALNNASVNVDATVNTSTAQAPLLGKTCSDETDTSGGLLGGLLGGVTKLVCKTTSTALPNLNTALAVHIHGTVQQILDGKAPQATASLTLLGKPISLNVNSILGPVQDVLKDDLESSTPVSNLTNDITSKVVDPTTTDLLGSGNTVGTALSKVLSVTLNNQSTSGGTFTETALKVGVLPTATNGGLATVNLASASVGPNVTSTTTGGGSGSNPGGGGGTTTGGGSGNTPVSTTAFGNLAFTGVGIAGLVAAILALLAAGAYLVREGYRRNGRRQIP